MKIFTLIVAMAVASMTTVSAFTPNDFVKESDLEHPIIHKEHPVDNSAKGANQLSLQPLGDFDYSSSRGTSEVDLTKFDIGVCHYSDDDWDDGELRTYINKFIPTEDGYKLDKFFDVSKFNPELKYDTDGKLYMPLGQVLYTSESGYKYILTLWDNLEQKIVLEGAFYINVKDNILQAVLGDNMWIDIQVYDKDGNDLGWYAAAKEYAWYISNATVKYNRYNVPVCIFSSKKSEYQLTSYLPEGDGFLTTFGHYPEEEGYYAYGTAYWSYNNSENLPTGKFYLYDMDNFAGYWLSWHERIETTAKFDDKGVLENITFKTNWTAEAYRATFKMYPPATITVNGIMSITDIEVDDDAPVEYYNLQGIKVNNPTSGQLLIKKQGNKATKIRY